MSNQRERDEFLAIITRLLPDVGTGQIQTIAGRMIRYSTTLNRLAVAACNGDWPADNGERKTKVCDKCGCGWAPSSMVQDRTEKPVNGVRPMICQDCRTADLFSELVKPFGMVPIFNGDPRGAVVMVKIGDRDVYVPPSRRF